MLDEKEAQRGRLTIVGQAVFFFSEKLWTGRHLQMIAREEVGRKASAETAVARTEVVEV